MVSFISYLKGRYLETVSTWHLVEENRMDILQNLDL